MFTGFSQSKNIDFPSVFHRFVSRVLAPTDFEKFGCGAIAIFMVSILSFSIPWGFAIIVLIFKSLTASLAYFFLRPQSIPKRSNAMTNSGKCLIGGGKELCFTNYHGVNIVSR